MGRIRLPSSRARAAAEAEADEYIESPTTSSKRKKTISSSFGSLQEEELESDSGVGQDGEFDSGAIPELTQEEDNTLYCICLGKDDKTSPMIQCEHCANWFHFHCINLTASDAKVIEAFCCDLCEEMGSHPTRRRSGHLVSLEHEDIEVDDEKDLDVNLSGQESSASDVEQIESDDLFVGERPVKKRSLPRPRRGSKRAKKEKKPQLEEGDETPDDEEDGEYVGDEEVVLREKSRSKSKALAKGPAELRRRRGSSEISSPPPQKARPKPHLPNLIESSADTDKTRIHIVAQLITMFNSIFGASGATESTEEKASTFAKQVEDELFNGFSEVDPKVGSGPKGPRTKYTAKYRSLYFNLKSNAFFRSRIFANEFSPIEIVNISNEELLTPELRQMAESIRAASLKDSVREVLTAPTAKRTHKGEEEIDNGFLNLDMESSTKVAGNLEMVERERERELRQRSDSTSSTSNLPSDVFEAPCSRSPSPASAEPPTIAPVSNLPLDLNEEISTTPASSSKITKPRTSFDMASIWGQVKPSLASPTISNQPLESGAEEYDPFASTGDHDDLDDILSETAPKKDKGKQVVRPKKSKLEDLNPVWVGDVIVPEEGGFPSFAVQVGGDSFTPDRATWSQLLPNTLAMSGRIATTNASKYLVECIFAPSRELVIAILQPDLSGPTSAQPDKPIASRCQVKFQHVIDFYIKKDRIGVVSPPSSLKRVVKDIYIMPLKRGNDLPEFIELLDDHLVPESREEDLLLAVLVIQKGSLPGSRKAVAIPPPLPTATLPTSTALLPLSAPDLASLSSLLADPALLQSVLAGVGGQNLLNTPGLLQALSSTSIPPSPSPAPISGLPTRPPTTTLALNHPSNRPSAASLNDQQSAYSPGSGSPYGGPPSRNYPPSNFDRGNVGSASPMSFRRESERRPSDDRRESERRNVDDRSGGRGFVHPDRERLQDPIRIGQRSPAFDESRGYGNRPVGFLDERPPYGQERGDYQNSYGARENERGSRGSREFDSARDGGYGARGGR